MANPVVTAALDKATYAIGETMTLTTTRSDPDRTTLSVTITATDAEGNASAPVTLGGVIDPSSVTVVSTPSRTWTKVSDTGTVAVFTAVA